jgi:hypothetical protein
MSKPLLILAASISLLSVSSSLAQSKSSPEIAELRREIESLRSTVQELKQQVNQARLAPVFDPHDDHEHPRGEHHNHAAESKARVHPEPEGSSLFNPDISVALDLVGSYSRRADNLNLIARDVQITLEADVDEYARAYVVLNAATELAPLEKTDPFEEISLGLEEAAIETRSLPWGLKLKAGQFFADFTRIGKMHAHDMPFTDRPLSVESLVGGETKARGLEFSWVPPIATNWRLTAGVVDHVGAEPYVLSRYTNLDGAEEDSGLYAERTGGGRGFDNLTYYGRIAARFQFAPSLALNVGGNYLRGRDTGTQQLASGDFLLTWTPRPGALDLLEVGGEFLWGKQSGRLSDDFAIIGDDVDTLRPASATARGRGGYVYAQYRFGRFFQPGLRFDYLRADEFSEVDEDLDGERDLLSRQTGTTTTYSAYANLHLGESNRIRLQLNYVKGEPGDFAGADDDWQAFVQWTVLFGRSGDHVHGDAEHAMEHVH